MGSDNDVGVNLGVALGVLFIALMLFSGCAVAADACEHPLSDVEALLGKNTKEKPVTYSGVDGARLIGFLYAQPQVPGFPMADSVVTLDGPNDETALLMVSGKCVTFATEVSTSGWKRQMPGILHGDDKKPAEQL